MSPNLSDADLAFALDFDAACLAIGLDTERQLREAHEAQRGKTKVTRRTMGT
jgi:hypothetical protein